MACSEAAMKRDPVCVATWVVVLVQAIAVVCVVVHVAARVAA